MSVICYMSVKCLVIGGVDRVRLYIIYAHLCNHILLQSGWWDLGHRSVHCRGVGSGSRDVDAWRANDSVRRRSGAPSTDDPGAWPRHLQRPSRAGSWSEDKLRIQIDMFRPIQLDHTNCLQVDIKTHSYSNLAPSTLDWYWTYCPVKPHVIMKVALNQVRISKQWYTS
jgi:hypothetical protein